MVRNVSEFTCDRCGKTKNEAMVSFGNEVVYPKGWHRISRSQDLCPMCYKRYLEIMDDFFRGITFSGYTEDDLK